MSFSRRICFLITVLWSQSTFAQSRENFLPNPGFEEGWKYWAAGPEQNGTVSIDDKVSHSGKRSLRLEYSPATDARMSLYLYASNQIGAILVPGHVYTYSGWIKIAGVPPGEEGPVAYLAYLSSDNRELGGSELVRGNTDATKNDGWVFFKHSYLVLSKAPAHQFRCQCHAGAAKGVGAVWFDDLKLEEGEQASAFRPDSIDLSEHYSYEPSIPWLPVPVDFRSSLEIVTPHVELARGYAGGAPRVLWAGFYNNARVGCELAERGNLLLDSVVFNGSSVDMTDVRILHTQCVEMFRQRLGIRPMLPPERAVRSLVIEQGTLEILSKADRDAIVDGIAQGMGCVVLLGPIYGPGPGHPGAVVTPKIAELIRATDALPQPGHGRVVVAMNAMQHPLWRHGTLGIESAYSDILQAIYTSIGRPPITVGVSFWPQKPIAGKPWTAIVVGKAKSLRCRVIEDLPAAESSLNDGYGVSAARTVVAEVNVAANSGGLAETRVAMRPLTSGKYMLLAQTLDEQNRVTGWSLAPLTVESSVEIEKLDAGKATFIPNEPLPVLCTIKNYFRKISNARLITQIKDPQGRVLSYSSLPISIAEGRSTHDVAITLAHAESSSVELHVYVELLNSAGNNWVLQSQTKQWLSSERLMPRVDFHVGPYDDYNNGWRDLGGDMNIGPAVPDLGQRPFLWLNLLGAMGPKRSVCDPESVARGEEYVAASLASTAPWTSIGCILHDELDSYGFGAKENSYEVAFFRLYLRDTYKDLHALNRSWGTKFTDWDQIDAAPTKINFVTQGDRNPAPWADWCAASEMAAHRFYAAMDRAARQVDPGLRVGPGGTRNTSGANGVDWWLLSHDFRSICLYTGLHNEIYRSFAPEGHIMTNWSHLDALNDSDALRVRIWKDVLAQCDGTPVYGGRYINVFYPDYRPKPGLPAYAAELADIRRGFGRLISGLKRNDATVAIFYSPASYRARIVDMHDVLLNNAPDDQNNLLSSLSAALSDARIGAHFIAYEQVSKGELDPKTTKVLFLWGALALSNSEAAAIWTYMKAGGTVIADCEPGIYDEHCHRRLIGPFHECLSNVVASTRVGAGNFLLYRDLSPNYVKVRGYQYEGTPASPSTITPANSKELLQASTKLRTILAEEAGVEPSFRLTDDKGQDYAHAFSAFDYLDGQARYVAYVPEGTYGNSFDARLTISGQVRNNVGHVYDSRQGKYLGEAAGVHAMKLRESTANLFAILPYRVERLELSATAQATPGQSIGFRATLIADHDADHSHWVRHVVVVQMRLADGRELPEHRAIVETRDGRVEGRLWLAFNDPLGKCTLIARDVATGVSANLPIEVLAAR